MVHDLPLGRTDPGAMTYPPAPRVSTPSASFPALLFSGTVGILNHKWKPSFGVATDNMPAGNGASGGITLEMDFEPSAPPG